MLTKQKIIQTLCENKVVENIVLKKINFLDIDLKYDLIQEVYLILLEKDENKIIDSYINNKLLNYVKRIIYLTINSKTSPFYFKYLKYNQNKTEINEIFTEFREF